MGSLYSGFGALCFWYESENTKDHMNMLDTWDFKRLTLKQSLPTQYLCCELSNEAKNNLE
jgi:hypothetical protein